MRVDELNEWATEVLKHKQTFLSGGTVPDGWHASRKVPIPPIFKRVYSAYWDTHTDKEYQAIATTIQQWPEAGGMEGLILSSLKNHRKSAKGHAQKRWKDPMTFFAIASLVKRHGIALRKLFHDDTPPEELVTPAAQIKQLSQQCATIAFKLDDVSSKLSRATEANRKMKERSKATRDTLYRPRSASGPHASHVAHWAPLDLSLVPVAICGSCACGS